MSFDFDVSDLVENPTTRVPVILVLDVSGSMSGEPIKELENGVRMFIEEVKKDEIASSSVEIGILTFGGNVNLKQDFSSVDKIKPISFSAYGDTPMGEAVKTSIEILEKRKELYRKTGVDYHQPWMVLMTDGAPTDDIAEAEILVKNLINDRKLVVFPIAIGENADINVLARFSAEGRPPLRLKGLKFREFFVWLSKSVANVSRSSPTERIKLDPNIKGWAEL